MEAPNLSQDNLAIHDASKEADCAANSHEENILILPEIPKEADVVSNGHKWKIPVPEVSKDADTVLTVKKGRCLLLRLRLSNLRQEVEIIEQLKDLKVEIMKLNVAPAVLFLWMHHPKGIQQGLSASVMRILRRFNSCQDHRSRMTASIGSTKLPSNGDNFGKELQCTADLSKVSINLHHPDDPSSHSTMQDNNVDTDAQKCASLQTLSGARHDLNGGSLGTVFHLFAGEEERERRNGARKIQSIWSRSI